MMREAALPSPPHTHQGWGPGKGGQGKGHGRGRGRWGMEARLASLGGRKVTVI